MTFFCRLSFICEILLGYCDRGPLNNDTDPFDFSHSFTSSGGDVFVKSFTSFFMVSGTSSKGRTVLYSRTFGSDYSLGSLLVSRSAVSPLTGLGTGGSSSGSERPSQDFFYWSSSEVSTSSYTGRRDRTFRLRSRFVSFTGSHSRIFTRRNQGLPSRTGLPL